jgi:hypothetical protein
LCESLRDMFFFWVGTRARERTCGCCCCYCCSVYHIDTQLCACLCACNKCTSAGYAHFRHIPGLMWLQVWEPLCTSWITAQTLGPWNVQPVVHWVCYLISVQESSGLMIIRDHIYWPIYRDYHHAFGEFLSSKLNTVAGACFLRGVRQWPADQQITTWGFDKTMQRHHFVVRIWFWPSPARQLHQSAVLVSSCLNIFLNQMVIRSQHTGIDMGVSCVGYMCSADG